MDNAQRSLQRFVLNSYFHKRSQGNLTRHGRFGQNTYPFVDLDGSFHRFDVIELHRNAYFHFVHHEQSIDFGANSQSPFKSYERLTRQLVERQGLPLRQPMFWMTNNHQRFAAPWNSRKRARLFWIANQPQVDFAMLHGLIDARWMQILQSHPCLWMGCRKTLQKIAHVRQAYRVDRSDHQPSGRLVTKCADFFFEIEVPFHQLSTPVIKALSLGG